MQCEYIIAIDKVVIVPLIALLHRLIASRLCELTFSLNEGSNLKKKRLPVLVGAFAPANQASTSGFCFHLGALVIVLGLPCFAHMLQLLRNCLTIF